VIDIAEWTNGPGKPVRIWEGDCLEFMRDLPDGCVDFVFADPPYNVGLEYDGVDDKRRDYPWWVGNIGHELRRISQRTAITPGIINIWLHRPADWTMCWFKPAAMRRGKLGSNHWEPILIYGEKMPVGGCDVIRALVHGQYGAENGSWHPAPKPESLLSQLIKRFSGLGDLVLDPFLGSGTTGVVCDRLDRRWIGAEINRDYVKMATQRIERARAQLRLQLTS